MAQLTPTGPAEDIGPLLRTTTATMSSLTCVFMAVRLSMGVVKRRFGWEDGLLCFGWSSYIAMCTSDALATKYDFGKALSDVAPENLANMRLFSGLVASITWSFAITSVKGSFAFLYMRFLAHTGRGWVVPLNTAVLVFLACQAIEEVSVVIFQCVPIESQWRPDVEGACYGLAPMWICDPIPAVWSLRFTSTAKKFGIIAMLSLGLFVCIISIIRLFAVIKLIQGDYGAYERAIAVIWCQVEVGTLIICSCVPHLHQVAVRIEPVRKFLHLEASNQQNMQQGVVTRSAERWRNRIKSFKGLGARRGTVVGDEESATAADTGPATTGPTTATSEDHRLLGGMRSYCQSAIPSLKTAGSSFKGTATNGNARS
ncbi:hypothetical protein RB595_002116 [Gaeumannomyces hyphopodioides]